MGLNLFIATSEGTINAGAFLLAFGFLCFIGLLVFIFASVWRELPEVAINSSSILQKLGETPAERGRLTQQKADYIFSAFRSSCWTRAAAQRKAEAYARRVYGNAEVDAFLKYGDYRLPPE